MLPSAVISTVGYPICRLYFSDDKTMAAGDRVPQDAALRDD